MVLRSGRQFQAVATRGVSWELELPLCENDGTASEPVKGTPLDLSTWPFLYAWAYPVESPGVRINVEVAYVFQNPARVFLRLSREEMEKAATSNECLSSINFTLFAGQTDRSERVLLNGSIEVEESGYTAAS